MEVLLLASGAIFYQNIDVCVAATILYIGKIGEVTIIIIIINFKDGRRPEGPLVCNYKYELHMYCKIKAIYN